MKSFMFIGDLYFVGRSKQIHTFLVMYVVFWIYESKLANMSFSIKPQTFMVYKINLCIHSIIKIVTNKFKDGATHSSNIINISGNYDFTRFTVIEKWIHFLYTGAYGMLKPGKEVALTILINLSNGRVYITLSVITLFFPVDPDDRVIVELQCTAYSGVTVYR